MADFIFFVAKGCFFFFIASLDFFVADRMFGHFVSQESFLKNTEFSVVQSKFDFRIVGNLALCSFLFDQSIGD